MADLNKELNEYLLSSKNEKQYKLPSVSIPKPNIGKWLGRSTEEKQESGWLRETQRECCPTMTRLQRLSAFGLCFVMGIMCFCLSALYVPVLLLKARKFALLYSLGSLFFLMSFAFLWGPMNYMRSLFSKERRFCSSFVTLQSFNSKRTINFLTNNRLHVILIGSINI
ncbi:vesicle transport protein SFT2C isoform X1 [Copidosoma floridanum]|uniref:vesicle transport protein SFT2C isoform X1 n=1 Tax=Copidosoma floridanum TaxID=29053 RepID=UPI0006C93CF6|nr:vesicle transport protein SFT2C isoform X1 [Copidosoma floridanum]